MYANGFAISFASIDRTLIDKPNAPNEAFAWLLAHGVPHGGVSDALRKRPVLQAFSPEAWFAMLMGDSVDLRSGYGVRLVDDGVWKAVEVVETQSVVAMRATKLVLDKKVSNAFELRDECLCDRQVRVLGIVSSRRAKFGLCIRVKPVAHPSLARTRASASSPGTMDVFPDRTSSRRALASLNHAACDMDFGSKLARRRSTSLARSSGGRMRAFAARSSTGVDTGYLTGGKA